MMRVRSGVGIVALVVGGVMMAGCAETQLASVAIKEATSPPPAPKQGLYKVGEPYQIEGVWYYPAEDYSYNETGIASWYGPNFHKKFTANGEIFDQNEVSAAHRTLPMPSLVRVTNLENGRSIVVRVNDRGPFAHGRIIDLSRRAAQLLAFEQNGTARVRVEILAQESMNLKQQLQATSVAEAPPITAAPRAQVSAETLPPPGSKDKPKPVAGTQVASAAPLLPSAATVQPNSQTVLLNPVKPTQMYVQAGAFARYDNAHRLGAKLSMMGPIAVSQVETKTGTMFRVRLGPIPSLDEADAMLEKVIHSGYPSARLVVD
jgi:rare lipoprotein A